jgi:ribosomal protein S18 acetylase RimI-like enzyme
MMNNTSPYLIREGTPTDGKIVAQLIAELADSIGETASPTAEYVNTFLGFPGSHIFLAEQDGQVVGMLSFSIRPNLYHAESCCLVDEVVVAETARGRGVGKALVQRLMLHAKEAGCAEASLSVLPGNTRAREFYRALGFTDEAILMEIHFEPTD